MSGDTRQTEVEDLHRAAVGEEDVLRLEIAVHDAVAMGIPQGLADVARDPPCLGRRQGSFAQQPLPQRDAAEQFHRDERPPRVLVHVEDADDAAMVERTRDRELAAEALASGRVEREVSVQQLDRDLRPRCPVVRGEHFGEPARADPAP